MSISTLKDYERKLGPTGVHYPLLSEELRRRTNRLIPLDQKEAEDYRDAIFDVYLEEGGEQMPRNKIGYIKLMELRVDLHTPNPDIPTARKTFADIVQVNRESPNPQLSSVLSRFERKYFSTE